MDIQNYITANYRSFAKGNSSEHTFRGSFNNLSEISCFDMTTTNKLKKTDAFNFE